MYLGPAHRKSRYRQLMARVGRGDDIIGHFSTLLSGGEREGALQCVNIQMCPVGRTAYEESLLVFYRL